MPDTLHERPRRAVAVPAWAQPALLLLLALLCWLSYRGMLDNGLFNDDFSWLRAARYEMAPGNVLGFRVVDFFRPLVNLSFYAMERLRPGNVPVQYAVNLCLHFLCSILVYRVVLNITRMAGVAAATAVLFAVSSVHQAAVLWMSARTTLLATVFLLASLAVVTGARERRGAATALATLLYTLALASKEEAIAGLLIVALLFLLGRRREDGTPASGGALLSFGAVSIAYLILRQYVMGGFHSPGWGPGAHVLRNVGGGFLYQLYPWPFLSLFYPRAATLPPSSNPILPELLALPLAVILVWAGYAAKKALAMNAAVGVSLLALLPTAPFRYRFFSTDSISQDRYYYLSSVGSTLAVVLLLSILWSPRSRPRRAAAIAVFALLLAGSIVRVDRLERKWDAYTRICRGVVEAIIHESDTFHGVTTLAIENPPFQFGYVRDALALERPAWRVVQIAGGRSEAAAHAPCLYISFTDGERRVMRVVKLEKDR